MIVVVSISVFVSLVVRICGGIICIAGRNGGHQWAVVATAMVVMMLAVLSLLYDRW